MTSICTIKDRRYSIEWLLTISHKLGMRAEFLPTKELEAAPAVRRFRKRVSAVQISLGDLPELDAP